MKAKQARNPMNTEHKQYKKVVSFSLDQESIDLINAIAKVERWNKSTVIQQALKELYRSLGGMQRPTFGSFDRMVKT